MSGPEDRILQEFLAESLENLDALDQDLVALELDPSSHHVLSRIFRTLHTLKGTCGFLGFARLEALAHAGESLLARLRDGGGEFQPAMADALLVAVDRVREHLAAIEGTGQDAESDDSVIIRRLQRLHAELGGEPSERAPASPKRLRRKAASAPPPRPKPVTPAEAVAEAESQVAATPAPSVRRTTPSDPASPAAAGDEPAETRPPIAIARRKRGRLFDSLIASGRLGAAQVEEAERQQNLGDPRLLGEILVDQGALGAHEVVEALNQQRAAVARSEGQVRVDVQVLDRLVDLVGELVLARNQLVQRVTSDDLGGVPATCQRVSAITSQLQNEVLKTRMQPVRTLWDKLPRLVRDVASACGKDVRLVLEGGDTELDRSVLEAVRDPLLHLVRNAIDHGIEDPATRARLGKPAAGTLRLRAFHEGGRVHLEIAEDGAGIDVGRVRETALARGLVRADEAAAMTEREWLEMVFRPGFSTAERVTNVSGRGVGMDVVKTNLERIGGSIEIETEPAEGTTVRLRIPLTLAIIPALIVEQSGQRYALPQGHLVELLRLSGAEPARALEWVQGAAVFRLRGRLLTVASLGALLGGAPLDPTNAHGILMVLHSDDRTFGLLVDAVADTQEIVVKPLQERIHALAAYAGATILGDGRVALILDVAGLARLAGIGHTHAADGPIGLAPITPPDPRTAWVLFEPRPGWRAAVPLDAIERIEEFATADLEQVGGRTVIHHRGELLPVLALARVLDGNELPIGDRAQVPALVCSADGARFAWAIARVVDIVRDHPIVHPVAGRPGVLGTAVLDGHATDLVDLSELEPLAAERLGLVRPGLAA